MLAQLCRKQPHLVGLVRLGRPVGHVVRPGEDGILGHDVDEVTSESLEDHRGRGSPGDEKAPF